MATLFYVHWNEEECLEHVRLLEAEGHTVSCHWSTQSNAKIPAEIDALVISLDRLPSHGRAVADAFWSAKKRQVIPVVFVGGEEDKVKVARDKFPKARFCRRKQLVAAVARITDARADA